MSSRHRASRGTPLCASATVRKARSSGQGAGTSRSRSALTDDGDGQRDGKPRQPAGRVPVHGHALNGKDVLHGKKHARHRARAPSPSRSSTHVLLLRASPWPMHRNRSLRQAANPNSFAVASSSNRVTTWPQATHLRRGDGRGHAAHVGRERDAHDERLGKGRGHVQGPARAQHARREDAASNPSRRLSPPPLAPPSQWLLRTHALSVRLSSDTSSSATLPNLHPWPLVGAPEDGRDEREAEHGRRHVADPHGGKGGHEHGGQQHVARLAPNARQHRHRHLPAGAKRGRRDESRL